MKKITLFLFVSFFLIGTAVEAQKKIEKRANKVTAEMTKVLELTKKEAKAVLKVQIAKMKEGAAIRKQHKGEPEVRKAKLKKLGNRVYNDMKAALGGGEKGKMRLKKWKKHLKDKKTNP